MALAGGAVLLGAGCGNKEEVSLPVQGRASATSIPTPAPDTTGSAAVAATPALPSAPLSKVLAKADPAGDPAWTTEQFSEDAGSQLGKILLPFLEKEEAEVLPGFLAAGFRATALRPTLKTTFKDKAFKVLRPETLSHEFTFVGEPGFRDAIIPLRTALAQSNEPFHGKTKIVRVEAGGAGKPWSTLVYFEANRGPIQQNAEWQCTWLAGTDSAKPLLESISVVRFEEIHSSAGTAGTPVPFADCTEAVLAANRCWKEQLVHGAPHWHGNLDVAFGIHQGNQGISVADTNGDDLEDVYICQPDGLPNRFFLQQPDGTLVDHSRESRLDFLDVSRCSLLVDLDNDGDSDCVLSHRFSVTFLENDGNARFTRRKSIDTDSRVIGLSAADYDNDGDLDVYVCGYSPMGQTSPEDIFANPVPYEDAHNGAPNYLFKNDGPFIFADATAESGLNETTLSSVSAPRSRITITMVTRTSLSPTTSDAIISTAMPWFPQGNQSSKTWRRNSASRTSAPTCRSTGPTPTMMETWTSTSARCGRPLGIESRSNSSSSPAVPSRRANTSNATPGETASSKMCRASRSQMSAKPPVSPWAAGLGPRSSST